MIKTLTFTAAFAIACLFSFAQIKKDAVLLGGQISIYDAKTTDAPTPNYAGRKNSNALFNLSAGKAIHTNTVIGLYGGYGKSKSEDTYVNNSSNSTTGSINTAGIFYRKYKGLGKNFYFFGEVNAGYRALKQEYKNQNGSTVTSTQYTETGGELGLTPGVSYQVFKKMQLEILMPSFAGLRYATTKNSGTGSSTQKGNVFQFNTSLNGGLFNGLAVGFRFVL